MKIDSFRITGFRPIKDFSASDLKGLNTLLGVNGSGKTTTLDALYFLACGRSSLALPASELFNKAADYFFLEAKYSTSKSKANISSVLYARNKQKTIMVNGSKKGNFINLIGYLKVALYNYNSLQLVQGEPSERRKYLDVLISAENKGYLMDLAKNKEIVLKRNALLKSFEGGLNPVNKQLLEIYDEDLINTSNRIFEKRKVAITKIDQKVRALLEEDKIENLQNIVISYDQKVLTKNKIEALRAAEIAVGKSLVGSHLDDFKIEREGKKVKETLSLGQTKLAALYLILGGAEYTKELCGDYPVLFLDDFSGDIDPINRWVVSKILTKFEQVFLTVTDERDMDIFPDCNIIYVKN